MLVNLLLLLLLVLVLVGSDDTVSDDNVVFVPCLENVVLNLYCASSTNKCESITE